MARSSEAYILTGTPHPVSSLAPSMRSQCAIAIAATVRNGILKPPPARACQCGPWLLSGFRAANRSIFRSRLRRKTSLQGEGRERFLQRSPRTGSEPLRNLRRVDRSDQEP
ncbi:hypothetical protein ebA2213 [Aromatoleum aromaticum EbN1]|uniref:Uncharacterized protein n=1 Tax=Aromatoleum aromaticum (strain DSM 19018 / LMG 30748 / EbN1) TaxID=76114 RepID=Q5P5R5_AROAE|nr:hypothetical protein ebA2213 [Aromatoleum aromaticum EbN1]